MTDRAVTDRAKKTARQRLVADLDAIAGLALDARVAARLSQVRRLAVERLEGGGASVSGHWMNWAPVGLALVLVLVTSWNLLIFGGQSLDAEILADSLPVDAYLDADFEASVQRGDVQLLEN
ncbi:MAG: hypothetical protein FGM40_06235 [Rhodocyclaceae bacterium]|nr:hypothetical protein [Rhodocyclaceae bacterium]